MKCLKCGNLSKFFLVKSADGKTGVRCQMCTDKSRKASWIKWVTPTEKAFVLSLIKEDRTVRINTQPKKVETTGCNDIKRSAYERITKLTMQNMTKTIANVVMKFVDLDKKPTREEVALAIWNWLKRK